MSEPYRPTQPDVRDTAEVMRYLANGWCGYPDLEELLVKALAVIDELREQRGQAEIPYVADRSPRCSLRAGTREARFDETE